jgi:dienelactone hydrolase
MNTILVTDIFGKTAALDEIAASVAHEVEVLDPYHAEVMNFNDEAEAYRYFASEIGLEAYAALLLETITAKTGPIMLIGFSVGAAAIWKISDLAAASNVASAIGFYGSQIRYSADIVPLFPVKLIFPAAEPHFSISELIATLSNTDKVQIQQVTSLHGFMNRHSQNFDTIDYEQFMKELSAI